MGNLQQTNSGSNSPNDHNNQENKPNHDNIEEYCRICFNQITNRSLTDTCRHQFCFNCLWRWSQGHNECPFCRGVYRNILYNMRSQKQFNYIPVRQVSNHENQNQISQDLVVDQELEQLVAYRSIQLRVINRLNRSLVQLDPNSIAYIETMQRIANAEERLERSNALIQEMRQNLRRRLVSNIQNDRRDIVPNKTNSRQNNSIEPEAQPAKDQDLHNRNSINDTELYRRLLQAIRESNNWNIGSHKNSLVSVGAVDPISNRNQNSSNGINNLSVDITRPASTRHVLHDQEISVRPEIGRQNPSREISVETLIEAKNNDSSLENGVDVENNNENQNQQKDNHGYNRNNNQNEGGLENILNLSNIRLSNQKQNTNSDSQIEDNT